MAVLSVTEYAKGREGIVGQVGRRLYRRVFVVVTDTPYDDPLVVTSDPEIPQPYDPYQTETTFDNRVVVRSVIPRQRDNNRMVWDVIVEYDSEYEVRDNPFTELPEIRADSETYEQPLPGRAAITYDPQSQSPQSEDPAEAGDQILVWGEGITTSAGEPFDPPVTITKSRPIIVFTRNEPNFSVAFKVRYENTVNKLLWSGLQPRQAWLRSIRATNHVQKSSTVGVADIHYYRVEYTFALRAETWDLMLLDIGSYYVDWSTGSAIKKAFKVEGTGEPRLGLLDHSNPDEPGKKLASDSPAQWLRWRAFREESYSNLGINLNLALEQRRARRR